VTAAAADGPAGLGGLVLDLLAGRLVDAPGPLPPALAERPEDDPVRRTTALALAHRHALPLLVHAAVAGDALTIAVDDGSTLPVATAHRLLDHKEERRVYSPLRSALENALHQATSPATARATFLAHAPNEPNSSVPAAALAAFLAQTRAARDEALALLGSAGGVAVEDGAALRRALELPDPALFGPEPVLGAVRQSAPRALDAARKQRRCDDEPQAPRRARAPLLLHGQVVTTAPTGPLTLLTDPTTPPRAGRQRALAIGAAAAVLHSAAGPRGDDPGDVDALGAAAALSLLDPVAHHHLDTPPARARRAFGVQVAGTLLLARAHAATLLALGADGVPAAEEPEACRDPLIDALGVDPGALWVALWLVPPWPGTALWGATETLVRQATAAMAQAALWLRLRDAFDEGWWFRPALFEAVAAGGDALPRLDPLPTGPTTPKPASTVPGAPPPPPSWATGIAARAAGWEALLSEVA
jgi:hypothetical protein